MPADASPARPSSLLTTIIHCAVFFFAGAGVVALWEEFLDPDDDSAAHLKSEDPPMLTVVAHVRARPGKEDEVRAGLRALLAPTRAEPGCINYDMHESLDEPGLFIFHENWTSKPHLDAHLKSPHITAFFSRIDELLIEHPRIYLLNRTE